jgi:hypothetical protein
MGALFLDDPQSGASYLCKDLEDCPNPRGWNYLGCVSTRFTLTRTFLHIAVFCVGFCVCTLS